MAHNKRKKSRVNQSRGSLNSLKRKYGKNWHWWKSTPAWWHILNHRRPHRRANKRCETRIMKGEDPDNIAWPVAKKPHIYYW